jgi:hypothetical protein
MPPFEIDRDLFRRLIKRYLRLEREYRGFRAMLDEAKQRNPAMAREFEAIWQIKTDLLRNDPVSIETESAFESAEATEDDELFLPVLAEFLTLRERGRL